MKSLFACLMLMVTLLPLAAAAQDGKGVITNFIESHLSSGDRKVTLDGFQGALSSTASFKRLTIADATGVWLTIEDARLVWNRSALLRGRLEVDELSAGVIDLDHLPKGQGGGGGAKLPSPTSTVISLPSLPVAVHIGKIATGKLRLGPAILGEEVLATIDGSADLANGALDAKLSLVRTDGKEGRVVLDTAFANDTRNLKISLDVAEAQNGILAGMLGLPGKPSLAFSIKGDAPVSDFAADISLQTAGQPRVQGQLTIADLPDKTGLRFAVNLTGDVAPLLQPQYRPFFGAKTALSVGGTYLSNGVVTLDTLKVDADELTLDGSLALANDGLPARFDLTGSLRPSNGQSVLLPIPGQETRIGAAQISARYDSAKGDAFSLKTTFSGLERPGLKIGQGSVTADGTISRTGGKPDVQADVAADVAGLDLGSDNLTAALGDRLTAKTHLGWQQGGAVTLKNADITAGRARFVGDAVFSGLGGNLRITTTSALTLPDLAPYGGLAGRKLAGAAQAKVDGWYEPLGGAFDLMLNAATAGLNLGDGLPYTLINGDGTFAGRIMRNTAGTTFDGLKIATPEVTATLSGTVGSQSADVTLDAMLRDVAKVYAGISGPASVKGTLGRTGDTLRLDLSGQGPKGIALAGKGTATADFSAADLQVTASVADIAALVPQFQGPVSATGKVVLNGAQLAVTLDTKGPDGIDLAVAGTVQKDFSSANLTAKGGADLALANRFTDQAVLAGRAALDLVLAGPPAVGSLSGTISAQNASVTVPGPGIAVPAVDLTVTLDPNHPSQPDAIVAATVKAVAAQVQAGPTLAMLLDGPVELESFAALLPGGRIALEDIALRNGDARVAGKATVGGGSATADLRAQLGSLARLAPLTGLPLAGGVIANVSAQYRFADGSLTASVDGKTAGLSIGPAYAILGGDGTFSAKATGQGGSYRIEGLRYANQALTVSAPVATITPDRVTADVTADIASLAPLSGLAKRPLSGGLSATAKISYGLADKALSVTTQGTTRNISAGTGPAFDLIGGSGSFAADVSLANGALLVRSARYDNGILNVTAGLDGQRLTLDARLDSLGRLVPQLPGPVRVQGTVGLGNGYAVDISATGPAGTQAKVSGNVSAAMVPDLAIAGSAPLGLANAFLPSSVDVQGALAFNLRLSGELSPAGLSGTVTALRGRVSIPAAGLALTGLQASVDLAGGTARISATTGFTTGGKATVDGSVGLTGGYPVDLKVALQNVGLVKEPTVKSSMNGQLALTGAIAGTSSLTGRIVLGETEISLAFSSPSGDLIDVMHVNETVAQRATRERAGLTGQPASAASSGGGGSRLNLDITISAPNRVFIRGRGLDAELGGELRITGHAGDIIPIGQFDLIRGRLDILGRRLDLTEGSLQLQGTFDPVVRLVAATTANDVSVQITTSGTASAPTVTLSSSPDLPQDEILALLLFGKGIDKISALQALQLANAVRTLLGNGGEGLQGKIRKQFGLDDLDVTTDANGNVALKAGKYISKNVYTDVTVNAQGDAEVQLNLDITPSLTARGKVDSTGGTSLGIFFERDY